MESTTSKVGVLVGHLLRVPDLELDGHALVRGSVASSVDESRREVHPDDLCAGPRGKDRGRARARRRVEHPLSGLWVSTLHDDRVQVANRVRDALVGSVAPHHALTSLQLGKCHVSSLVRTAR